MKKTWQRRLTAFLAAAMLLALPAAAFSNTPAGWAAESVQHLEDFLLFNGLYSGFSRQSTARITRGEFCQLLVNVARSESEMRAIDAIAPKPANYFSDIATSVTQSSPGGTYDMYYAAAYGLTEGTTQGDGVRSAQCGALLTREQAAKMMCSLAAFFQDQLGATLYEKGTAKVFTDAEQISGWAREWVDLASACGIMQGDQEGRFNPAGTLTWEEACVMAARIHQAAMDYREKRDQALDIRTLETQMEGIYPTYYLNSSSGLYLLPGGNSVLRLTSGSAPMVETYRADGSCAGIKEIPLELAFASAFYYTDDHYFICFGQNNKEENNSKEVYRVVKYDHDWNRLGAASITGGESGTITPYRSTTHTGMAVNGDLLVLHTSRLRYTSSDGLNHQSNFTAKIRLSDMKVLSTSALFPDNHVSHSFAQYVAFDGDQVVYADHGDAYPRSFVINAEGDYGNWSSCAEHSLFTFTGKIGDNTTNADPGGLGISADNYLFLAASAPQKGSGESEKEQNLFLAVTPKSGFPNGKTQITWLTDFSGGNEWVVFPIFVQLNNNTFVAMWQSTTTTKDGNFNVYGDFCYAVFDGEGNQVGPTVTLEGYMVPGTDPLVEGNTISWVRPDRSTLYHSYSTMEVDRLKVYSIQIPLNGETAALQSSISLNRSSLSLQTGETGSLTANTNPSSGVTVTWSSSAPSVASVNGGTVTARSAGEATITAKMSYQGKTTQAACTVTVTDAPVVTGLTLNQSRASLESGKTLTLTPTVSPTGVDPVITWTTSNSSVVTVDKGLVTAHSAGTAAVVCTATLGGRSRSASCTITVTAPAGQAGAENQGGTGESTGSSGTTENPGGAGNTGNTGTSGGTGATSWPSGATSSAPSDGFYDYYQESYSNGDYFRVELTGENEITLSGVYTIPDNAASLYNYVVFSVAGDKAEIPYTPGVPFKATLHPDMDILRKLYTEKPDAMSAVSVMVCQNYTPGSSGYAGTGIAKASLYLKLDENENCILEVRLR